MEILFYFLTALIKSLKISLMKLNIKNPAKTKSIIAIKMNISPNILTTAAALRAIKIPAIIMNRIAKVILPKFFNLFITNVLKFSIFPLICFIRYKQKICYYIYCISKLFHMNHNKQKSFCLLRIGI